MTSLLPEIFVFLFGASYELCQQTTAMKWSLSMQNVLIQTFFWLHCAHSGCGINSQAAPGQMITCAMDCDEFASNQLCVSRSWTVVLFTWST